MSFDPAHYKTTTRQQWFVGPCELVIAGASR